MGSLIPSTESLSQEQGSSTFYESVAHSNCDDNNEDEDFERQISNFIFDPMKYPSVFRSFKNQNAMFWNPDEYEFISDAKDYRNPEKMDAYLKKIFEAINCFFLVGDGTVSKALIETINERMETEGMSGIIFLCVQLGNEAIHAVSYNTATEVIMGAETRKRMLKKVTSLKCVKEKLRYISEAETSSNNQVLSKALRMVRLACGEGLFFVTQFALIGLFKELNILNDFCALNNHIFKDEMEHAADKCLSAKYSLKQDEKESAIEEIKKAYVLETNFLKYLLFDDENIKDEDIARAEDASRTDAEGEPLIPKKYNISFSILADFAKIRCNAIAKGCGLKKIFNVERRTFPSWATLIGGSVKINFFEIKNNDAYRSSTRDSGIIPPCEYDDDEEF